MVFNSIDFAVFLPLVFFLYWFVFRGSLKAQNMLLLIASYVFYGWWDWRFLSLIFFSTLVDFLVGRQLGISVRPIKRKVLLWVSISVNLGLLGFFKYYNFFVDNFVTAFSFFGSPISSYHLSLILPVGISFYTFQTLSYTIDIYRKQLLPTANFIAFSTFVSFFPQLVAGPIERASHLLPQFYTPRTFDSEKVKDGLYLIIWGLFKKVVIADSCAQYVNDIFGNYQGYSSSTLFLGAIYFAFQIYGDFSGYSDIAIGTARLFGFRLMKNFNYPYFSRNMGEFWRRWHISLSTWFRDYVYIPLGGSRGNKWLQLRNVIIIFLLSGFWHGANWTFIVWGGLNALYFIPLLFVESNRKYLQNISISGVSNSFKLFLQIGATFSLTVVAWVFFRAENLGVAIGYLRHMGLMRFGIEHLKIERYPFELLPLIVLFVLIEWRSRNEENPIQESRHPMLKVACIMAFILLFGSFSSIQEFIYFQF